MKKSTALKIIGAIALAAVLMVAASAIVASRSYVECASRLVSGAPPTDSSPPPSFRRLSAAFWGHRDLYLARVLARECATEARGGVSRLRRELLALGVVKARLDLPQRETLSAVLLPAPGGRGLTRLAQAEWGRAPAALNESEMTWLFVVGQMPSCSNQGDTSEPDRQICTRLYQSLLAELPRLNS